MRLLIFYYLQKKEKMVYMLIDNYRKYDVGSKPSNLSDRNDH